jgi:hypothetical protein
MRIVTVSMMLVGLCGTVLAGPLAVDPNVWFDGTTLWHGTTNMTAGPNAEEEYLNVDVDWAVYCPDQFHWDGYVPTPGEFTYAYQVYVNPQVGVFKFSVGMLEGNDANNIGAFSDPPNGLAGVAPASMYFGGTPPDTANWEWASPGMLPGQNSMGLVYCSANAPLFFVGSIQNAGLQAAGLVPSPSDVIPEPATLVLAGVGAMMLLRRRR